MAQTYHVNPETLQIGKCSAEIKCQFADVPDVKHFGADQVEDAMRYIEELGERKYGGNNTLKKKPSEKTLKDSYGIITWYGYRQKNNIPEHGWSKDDVFRYAQEAYNERAQIIAQRRPQVVAHYKTLDSYHQKFFRNTRKVNWDKANAEHHSKPELLDLKKESEFYLDRAYLFDDDDEILENLKNHDEWHNLTDAEYNEWDSFGPTRGSRPETDYIVSKTLTQEILEDDSIGYTENDQQEAISIANTVLRDKEKVGLTEFNRRKSARTNQYLLKKALAEGNTSEILHRTDKLLEDRTQWNQNRKDSQNTQLLNEQHKSIRQKYSRARIKVALLRQKSGE